MSTFSHTRALLNHDVVIMKEQIKIVFVTLNRRHVLADSREGEGGAIGGSDSIWGTLGVGWGNAKNKVLCNWYPKCLILNC